MPIKDHPLSIALPQPGSRCFGQCSDNLRTGPWHRGMDAAGGSLMKHEKTHVLFNVSFSMDPPSLSAAQTSAIPSPRNKMNSSIHFEKRNTKVEPLTLGHPFLFVKLFTVSPFRYSPATKNRSVADISSPPKIGVSTRYEKMRLCSQPSELMDGCSFVVRVISCCILLNNDINNI